MRYVASYMIDVLFVAINFYFDHLQISKGEVDLPFTNPKYVKCSAYPPKVVLSFSPSEGTPRDAQCALRVEGILEHPNLEFTVFLGQSPGGV